MRHLPLIHQPSNAARHFALEGSGNVEIRLAADQKRAAFVKCETFETCLSK